MFIATWVTIAREWNQPRRPPADSEIVAVYVHNGVLFSYKEKAIFR